MNEADRDRRPPHDVTALLLAWRQGSQSAFEELIPIVYDELRRLAHRHLRGERRAHTLQTADLVHETYFRLVDSSRVQWQNRGHFFAVAAHACVASSSTRRGPVSR